DLADRSMRGIAHVDRRTPGYRGDRDPNAPSRINPHVQGVVAGKSRPFGFERRVNVCAAFLVSTGENVLAAREEFVLAVLRYGIIPPVREWLSPTVRRRWQVRWEAWPFAY